MRGKGRRGEQQQQQQKKAQLLDTFRSALVEHVQHYLGGEHVNGHAPISIQIGKKIGKIFDQISARFGEISLQFYSHTERRVKRSE